nr:ATPase, T2SS/T4P/T4SS family [Pyrinomonadaceae bacterium]
MIEKLNEYLQTLVSSSSYELRLEPNKNPFIVSVNGTTDVATEPLPGPQISMMVFPLIPDNVRTQLPATNKIHFVHPHNLGKFAFTVAKSSAGFVVSVRPVGVDPDAGRSQQMPETSLDESFEMPMIDAPDDPKLELVDVNDPTFQTVFSDTSTYDPPGRRDEAAGFVPPAEEYIPRPNDRLDIPPSSDPAATVVVTPEGEVEDRRSYADRRQNNAIVNSRMDGLFHKMAEVGASDLHLSVSMPPMVRQDGRMRRLECEEEVLTPAIMRELLHSIMPEKNKEEFEARNDTDFAYEIAGLARFRCNIFMDRKGMGGVFRIIPTKILTAEQLGLSKAVMDLCSLSKGLVVVTGPTGSGKSTTLCAMVDSINKNRDDHIITIEDPIEF